MKTYYTESTNNAIKILFDEYDYQMSLRTFQSLEKTLEGFNQRAWIIINNYTSADPNILIPLKDQLERRIF